MTVGAISGISGFYPTYNTYAVQGVRGTQQVTRGTDGTAQAMVDGARNAQQNGGKVGNVGEEECQTCKNRKYVDGSNEANVSFKTPSHIDPGNSAAAVMGHELEHVANARAEGSKENKELISASVTMQTAICPECGKTYVSGGLTRPTMKTTTGGDSSTNPYARQQGLLKYLMGAGGQVDMTA